MKRNADKIHYTPNEWTADQRACHESDELDNATYKACCLAGGWYRRPVTIYMQFTPENTEVYRMCPADAHKPEGWHRVYTIDAHAGERS